MTTTSEAVNHGARIFVEAGPGRVLTGLLKRIIDGTAGHSVEDPASLATTVAALTGRGAA